MNITEEELLRKIEAERARLNALAKRGFQDPEVLESSRILDELMEVYYQLPANNQSKNKRSRSGV